MFPTGKIYTQNNLNIPTKKLFELLNQFSKSAGYKTYKNFLKKYMPIMNLPKEKSTKKSHSQ